MRPLLIALLLLIAGISPADGAPAKAASNNPSVPSQSKGSLNGEVRDQVIPVGWNALLNHDQRTALVIGEFKREGKAHGTLEVLNRDTEAMLMGEITLLGYAVIRPTPGQPTGSNGTELKDLVLPIGWNALVNPEERTALIIGEYKTPGSARTSLLLVNRPTLSSLAKFVEDLGYRPILPTGGKPAPDKPAPPTPGTSGNKPLPKPKLSKDFVDMVVPVGWNALLNPEKRTAGIMGHFKTPGRAHTKLFLLSCDTQQELMSIIGRLGYTPLYPPAPGTPGGKPLPK